ncbi:MAG: hypothetical protein ACHQHN_01045 [Sphingobacteriales bacterium]
MMNILQNNKNIHYTLRFASAMCFFGHGAFGIIGKKIWLNYFAVFGIGATMGNHVMPWLGAVDILLGISLLLYPTRAVLGWLIIWGATTAMCRPLSGEPFAEFIERAGNFGAPLTLLLLSGINIRGTKGWFSAINPEIHINEKILASATKFLQVVVFLLLVGHGWLNLLEKKGIMGQYAALGFSSPANICRIVGIFEITAACIVLVKPIRPLLIALLVWKIGIELFYPHWEVFEWMERGGSYGAVLALWFMLPRISFQTDPASLTQPN